MEKIVVVIAAILIMLLAIALERGHLSRRSLQHQNLLNLRIKEIES